jgi:hypothetical protein
MCPQRSLADLLEDNRVAFEREFHGSTNASKITSMARWQHLKDMNAI